MRKTLSIAIVCLFAGMALAGCAANNGNGGTGGGAPQANVEASPLSPSVGEPVSFRATQAGATDTATWQFGDGETATGATASHTYTVPGQYIVHLNLTNQAGVSGTNDAALTYITVSQQDLDIANITASTAPAVKAASSAQVIQTGGNVKFDATGSGGWVENPDYDPTDPVSTASHNPRFMTSEENVTYSWDFGDGETATGVTTEHNFTRAGLFPVKLTVSAGGQSADYIITVRVLPEAPPTPGVRNPTVYTEVSAGEPESLDPAYDYESAGGHVLQNVYETLYFYERDSAVKLVPVLAASMPTYDATGANLTIKLRPNVKFHDGNTMTAEDVKFSLDRIILMNDPNGPAFIYYGIAGAEEYGHISPEDVTAEDRQAYLDAGGVTVVDPLTVRIQLAYPDPSFLYRLAFQGASIQSKKSVCEHAEPDFLDCLPPPGETRHPWMDTHEVGTGPFMLEAWIPGQQVILKRFEDYWGNKPALEKVIIEKTDDINTRLLKLFSGQADSVYVPVDQDVQVIGKPGIRITENPSWTTGFIGFNQKFCGGPEASGFQTCMTANGADAPKGADGRPDPLFFSDIHMRKAWTYAFDYDTYYNDILKKHGKMLNGALPEGIFGYDASIPAPKRNMELARQELAQTNHSNGFSVTIFYNSGNTVREKTANLMATNLKELNPNIRVDVRGLDWSTAFLPKQRAQALPVFYLGWAPDYAYPDNYLVTFAHSEKGVYASRVGYENPELNAKLDALLKETDEQELKTGYSEATRQLNEDFVYLWLGQSSNFHVAREWVKGYYYNPMQSGGPNTVNYATISKS